MLDHIRKHQEQQKNFLLGSYNKGTGNISKGDEDGEIEGDMMKGGPGSGKKKMEKESGELASQIINHKSATDEQRKQAINYHNKVNSTAMGDKEFKSHSKALDSLRVLHSEVHNLNKAMGTGNVPGKETVEKAEYIDTESVHKHTQKIKAQIAKSIGGDRLKEEDGADDTDVEKGGEGSKGGKVIGHTRSGKAIYDTVNHKEHKSFTKEDHEEAAIVHNYKADWGKKDEREKNRELGKKHQELSKTKEKDKENSSFDIDGEDKEGNLFTVKGRGKNKDEALKNARKGGKSGEKYYNKEEQKESVSSKAKDEANLEQNERARNVATSEESSNEDKAKAKKFLDDKKSKKE